jgi:hypothetical protein
MIGAERHSDGQPIKENNTIIVLQMYPIRKRPWSRNVLYMTVWLTNIGASLEDRVDPVTATILCLQGFLEETVCRAPAVLMMVLLSLLLSRLYYVCTDCFLLCIVHIYFRIELTHNMAHVDIHNVGEWRCNGPHGHSSWSNKKDDFCSWSMDDGFVVQLLPGSTKLIAKKSTRIISCILYYTSRPIAPSAASL